MQTFPSALAPLLSFPYFLFALKHPASDAFLGKDHTLNKGYQVKIFDELKNFCLLCQEETQPALPKPL